MTKSQKASFLASALSVLWLGLFCGQALARYSIREPQLELPPAKEFKAVKIPQFDQENTLVQPLPQPMTQPLVHPAAPTGRQGAPTDTMPDAGLRQVPTPSASLSGKSQPGSLPVRRSSVPPEPSQTLAMTQPLIQARAASGISEPALYAVINAGNTRLRLEPSTTATKIGMLQKGEVGKVLERREGWSRLLLAAKGVSGWIRDDLLVIP